MDAQMKIPREWTKINKMIMFLEEDVKRIFTNALCKAILASHLCTEVT